MGFAIETRGLVRRFGDVAAVDGIDLSVPEGSVYGFLGPNGSGKTTTIRLMLGLLKPNRGTVALFGGSPHDDATMARVGAVVERPAMYPYLSARDNLLLFGELAGLLPRHARVAADYALDMVGLTEASARKVGGFSTGMLQRLAIALALLREPALVILDEPTNGLDPAGVVDVRALIAELARGGRTVFLSTHVLTEVEQLCDRVAVLARGKVVADGPTAELLNRGRRLAIAFDTPDQARAAGAAIAEAGVAVERGAGPTELLAALDGMAPSAINRMLGERGLYPAELAVRRPSLESVFLELTEDQ